MATYNLDVHVSMADFKILKEGKFKLCVAKLCNSTYSVVWQGLDFFEFNTISWTEDYQVFGSQAFEDGALVRAVTGAVPIKYGQTAALDNLPVMYPASGPVNDSGTFTIDNQYGVISGGVNGLVGGKWAPIYVSGPIPLGTLSLTPKVRLLVFFSAEHQTGSMFAKAVARTIEVDFASGTNQSINYTGGLWSIGGNLVVPLTYIQESNTFTFEENMPTKDHLLLAIKNMNNVEPVAMKKFEVRAIATYTTTAHTASAVDFVVNNKPNEIVIRTDNADPLKANFLLGFSLWADAEAALKSRLQGCPGSDLIDTLQDVFGHLINGAPQRYTSLSYNFEALGEKQFPPQAFLTMFYPE